MSNCDYCGKELEGKKQLQKDDQTFCDNICKHSFKKKGGKLRHESNSTPTLNHSYPNEIKNNKVLNFLVIICTLISTIGIIIKGQYVIAGHINYNIIISLIIAILGIIIAINYFSIKRFPTLLVLTIWTILQILSVYSQLPGHPETIKALYEATPFANIGFQIGNQINDNFSIYFQFNIIQWVMLLFLSQQFTITKKRKLEEDKL